MTMRLRTLLAFIFAASALVLTLAGTIAVSSFVATRAQIRVEARLADLAEHLRQLIDANVAERLGDMAVLSAVARPSATTLEARRAWVDALHEIYPAYGWIGFADQNGLIVASTGGLLEGASVAARPWFQGGLDRPVVIDVHEAALLAQKLPALPYGEPKRFVDVAAPLHDAAGTTVGVVGGHLSVRWMREMSRAAIASAMAREPSVEALILASDGTVILGPGDRQGERILDEFPAMAALAAGAEQASARGKWPDGGDSFTGASRAHVSVQRPSLPWTVIVRQPVDVALAPAHALILRLTLGGVSFALLFALLGWWAAERLAHPLRALASAAHRIENTPADIHLPAPRGYLEINELTGALVGLLTRLGERDRVLAAVNVDLEQRVLARTAELVEARDRAEAAKSQAQAGERAKSEFLATMSHEVRTPLNAIKGFGDLLGEDGTLTPGQRRCVDQMRVGCEILTTVVTDILDFASVEAGRVVLEAAPFSPRTFIEETVAIVSATAERKGLNLQVEPEHGQEDMVLGDVTRLRQVLLNFLNNAVKFTAQGRVVVSLDQKATSHSVRLRVEVRDTGIGIAEEAQARLFNRFVQADSTTTRRFGGTGLGLAIAKGLIEVMGGETGLKSSEGAGSTFWFVVTLPRAEMVFDVAEVVPLSPSAPRTEDVERSRTRLLLVEDNVLNQEIAQTVLEAMGYCIEVACNGQEAVLAVQQHTYDLILMDQEMPVLDGASATRQIRALNHPMRNVPIVAMTAHVLPDQVASLRQAGADDHVGKPFDRKHLHAVIERCLASAVERDVTAA